METPHTVCIMVYLTGYGREDTHDALSQLIEEASIWKLKKLILTMNFLRY
jgi:hypothetical protein